MNVQMLMTFLAVAFSTVVTALPSQGSTSCTAGLTVWSDANFAGTSHQYNVAWNKCISIAGDFPYKQGAGVTSVEANAGNWCTMYPNTDCNPGQNRGNDTLSVIGSYYDLGNQEVSWDNLAQSFSCKQYNC